MITNGRFTIHHKVVRSTAQEDGVGARQARVDHTHGTYTRDNSLGLRAAVAERAQHASDYGTC
jgi:hypothetical protein